MVCNNCNVWCIKNTKLQLIKSSQIYVLCVPFSICISYFSSTCSILSCCFPSLLIFVHITHLNHVFLQGSLYRGQSRREKPRGRNQGLTQQKRQEIREAFELFDTDNSGNKINLKESILDIVFWCLTFLLTVNFCNIF